MVLRVSSDTASALQERSAPIPAPGGGKKEHFPAYWHYLGIGTAVARQGGSSQLGQLSDLTSKSPLVQGWLRDGSSSLQSLGQDSRRCPHGETPVPKHIPKTQLGRNEQAAREESKGGKWDHKTLKNTLKNSCWVSSGTVLQPVRLGYFSVAKICLQWFNMRPKREKKFKSSCGPDPHLSLKRLCCCIAQVPRAISLFKPVSP